VAGSRGFTAQDGLPSWAVVAPERAEHVERVVALLDEWATRLALAPDAHTQWRRAGWLHDALRDADEPTLRHWSKVEDGPLVLLHGPAAAARAAHEGEDDGDLLDAVRWHTVGSAEWAPVGRALYCADFLEPGRRFEEARRAALAASFAADPDAVLREVIAMRTDRAARTGKPVLPRTVAVIRAFG
jgi:2-amino-4-hydroxy-6-hydroxymethyldihydropteridine diphosphokinase